MEDITPGSPAKLRFSHRLTSLSLASTPPIDTTSNSTGMISWSTSSVSLMITTSQHGSPMPLDSPVKLALNRAGMYPFPSLQTSFAQLVQELRILSGSAASSIANDCVSELEKVDSDVESGQISMAESREGQALAVIEALFTSFNDFSHPSALPRSILKRIFDFYAQSLWEDTDHPQFATLETLLLVCSRWRNVAEQHGSMWAEFPITLLSQYGIKRWIARIRRRRGRIGVSSALKINIQDRRDLSVYEPPTNPRRPKLPAFLAHLHDMATLVMELDGSGDSSKCSCKWKSFRLAMPPNFPETINDLEGNARDLASLYLGRIFRCKMLSLESLELENVGWIAPPGGIFTPSELPLIFRWNVDSIQTLRLYNCSLPTIPSLDHPRKLRLEHCSHWSAQRKRWEPPYHINDTGNSTHTRVWADLQKITIGPLTAPLTPLSLPSLRTLEVIAWRGHESTSLVHISTLSVDSLHTLIISWPDTRFAHLAPKRPSSTRPKVIQDGISALFRKSENIRVIKAPRAILVAILSFLHEHSSASTPSSPAYRSRQLTLHEHGNDLKILITGKETAKQLRGIAFRDFQLSLPHWDSV